MSALVLKYQAPDLLDEALENIPLRAIYELAADEEALDTARAASISRAEKAQWGYQDYVIRELLRYGPILALTLS